MNDQKMEFGNRLGEIRKGRKISQETLAHKADLDRSYISDIEKAKETYL
ncbi:hypothetical protein GCM10028791_43360 [Echinicola sediminis]